MNENIDAIRSVVLKGKLEGPGFLLLGGVHGDEYEPMLAANRLSEILAGKLLKGKVTIVPVVNPSAFKLSSRYGSDGLDLARICPGNAAGSITEQYASRISDLIRKADYLVDMHTGGIAYDISPLAGYMLHSDPQILEEQRRMAFAYNLPVVLGTDPLSNGRSLSVARDAGIPGIYLEFGGGAGIQIPAVEAYISGFLNLLRQYGMLEGEAVTSPIEDRYWVEDFRSDSGNLLGKMSPSPLDGIFTSELQVGSFVKKGEKCGIVEDPLSGNTAEVVADVSGIAFLKRKLVKVKKGDALGGILPIERPGRIVIQ